MTSKIHHLNFIMGIFARNLRFVKFVFFVLLVSTAIVLLRMALQFQVFEEEEIVISEIFYEPERLTDAHTVGMLRENFRNCIVHPSKVFCSVPPGKQFFGKLGLLTKAYGFFLSNITKDAENSSAKPRHPLHAAFDEFTSLCDTHNVKMILIEPSMLFCMLTTEHQHLLLKRRLNLTNILGSENVLTLAVDHLNVTKLEEAEVLKEFQSAGFHLHSTKSNFKSNSGEVLDEGIKTHYFYIRQPIVIHVVVFYERSDYYWHSEIKALPKEVSDLVPLEHLLFSQTEAIYERFHPVEINAKSTVEILSLPIDPQLFLHEISTSTFLQCNLSRSIHMKDAKPEGHSNKLSEKVFNEYSVIALRELKVQLRPILVTFWIFGGTLLGWYRECGVIKYTHDVDFSAWALDIDDVDELVKIFKTNKHLVLNQLMGMKKAGLEFRFYVRKLMVDLFFTYDDGERFWVAGHRPSRGYYFPYNYPKFTLCSADLLGYKVQVPCDSEAVLLSDYGLEWDKPVSSWTYDKSPKNMGEKRYWNATEKDKVHVSF